MVTGSPDISASLEFWQAYFSNDVVGPIPYRIGVLSEAYDLPVETQHQLALVSMVDGYGIEIDQYPKEATSVPAPKNERGGVILVSLQVDPSGLKASLPWALSYKNDEGEEEGGVVILPSGAPIEVSFHRASVASCD